MAVLWRTVDPMNPSGVCAGDASGFKYQSIRLRNLGVFECFYDTVEIWRFFEVAGSFFYQSWHSYSSNKLFPYSVGIEQNFQRLYFLCKKHTFFKHLGMKLFHESALNRNDKWTIGIGRALKFRVRGKMWFSLKLAANMWNVLATVVHCTLEFSIASTFCRRKCLPVRGF